MRSTFLVAGSLFALTLGLVPAAHATTINFATGQNGSGTIQTTGDSLDANWKESNAVAPKLAPNSYVVDPTNADWFGGWFANGPNSSWIAPNPDNANGNGNFTLTYTFDLTGDNLATASFSGLQWTIDDAGNVQLNGHTETSLTSGQWGSFHAFTINTADLVQGINTLVINSTNSDIFLEAARLEGTLTISSGTTTTVPEPASLAIFGAALAGMGLIRRRRRSV